MGKIYVVGIGPGNREDMTLKAYETLQKCDIVVGYQKYIDLIREIFPDKNWAAYPMTQEIKRCEEALRLAESGKTVAVISSGDSGVYGMAGIMQEVACKAKSSVNIEVIPGVTACVKGASLLGAPLIHDFAVISLSDLLTPWEKIEKRLKMAAESDFVICIYNPKSKKRENHIKKAKDIISQYQDGTTPVGIVYQAGREGERAVITDLAHMLEYDINMFTTIIIGNSQTYTAENCMITPRGYRVES